MRRLLTMIKNAFKIAKLLSVDDSGDLRFGVVSMLGKNQKVMVFTPYGLMSKPPANSLALIWSQQGQESNGIGIADDPANRPLKNLSAGEVALGNYSTGNFIYFDENGLCTIIADDISIQAANDINMSAENISLTATSDIGLSSATMGLEADATMDLDAAQINIAGTNIGITGSLTNGGVNIGSTHIHSQGADSDGDTEQDTGTPHS